MVNRKRKSYRKNRKMELLAAENLDIPTIREFYRDSTILITGGTGFIGKVIIQKILSTYEPKRIYLLIRNKNNQTANQRLEMFFRESIFDNIRKHSPSHFNKVHSISVDFDASDLAISASDRNALINEVQIVFNIVASVKFNEKLHDAIVINVLGTRKILNLVLEMMRLKAFLHISTLYSNCNRKSIDERIYDPDFGFEKVIQLAAILDANELKKLEHCLVGDLPNTYTMTKRCSESLVGHLARELPAGIFRLPIVLSTYKEPFPGWTDNLYGPSGLCTSAARGFTHCIYGDSHKKANLVPADYCVNAMIASAWDISIRQKAGLGQKKTEIPVYNYIFDCNNLTWGRYMQLARKGFHEPFDKALWCFTYIIVPSKFLYRLTTFLLHNVPGYILDLIAMATGQKKMYLQGYRKMAKVIEMMSFFGLREWTFSNRNIVELDAKLSDEDRRDLEFNMNSIDWNEYFGTYMSGIRRYFYKDTDEKLKRRRMLYRRIYVLHILLKIIFGTLGIVLFSKLLSWIVKSRKMLNIG